MRQGRALVLALLCAGLTGALCAAPASADPRPHGLLWNHSGQTLTLPLQILTDPGADLYLTLDPGGGPVLAAYIRGGVPFRLLVPPGQFLVRIAMGRDWQGADTLFGAQTRHLDLPDRLIFGVQGAGRRAGHLVDLRDGDVRVRDYGLCRGGAAAPHQRPVAVSPPSEPNLSEPRTLAAPRRAETRLPPPDQPQIYSDDPRDRPFAQPFPHPAQVPIPRVGATQAQTPAPRGHSPQTRPRAATRWSVCE